MERDYEKEMLHVFGARLKLVYGLQETALPEQIVSCLERLERREVERAAAAAAEQAHISHDERR
jgi:hypothetical protein